MKRYYSLYKQENTADIYIYGDITSWPWFEEDVSSYNLSRELQSLEDVDNINVYINSYGGEVAEGLAIYNSLKRHKAKITTIADGFACSIASVIFAAGDERVISNTSLLMIHNAWTYAGGDSNDLRKQADDLEKITQASINAYMSNINIEEEKLKELLDAETWLNADECIEMGFATKLVEEKEKQVATQSIRNSIVQRVTKESEITYNTITIDKKELAKMVKENMQEVAESLSQQAIWGDPKEKEKEKENKNIENKPLSMMKAFFNAKEED